MQNNRSRFPKGLFATEGTERITKKNKGYTRAPPSPHKPPAAAKVELGKKLFFDRRLSGDGTMSCSSCHDPEMAYTDGLEISLSYPTTRNWRNSPTLINVAFQKFLFHDGRAGSLEDQALFPMMSAFELNQNLDFLEEEIRSVPEYVESFRKVFGDPDVTRQRIAMSIAAFERTLISEDAPLDRHLKGDKKALSSEALKGYDIFMGKGKCSECHHGANLVDDKFHSLYVPENPEHLIDPRTAPDMHNGIFATLDEVIDFFDQGGGRGNSALKPLRLTAAEKKQLKAFLTEALAGKEIKFDYPKLP